MTGSIRPMEYTESRARNEDDDRQLRFLLGVIGMSNFYNLMLFNVS